jgi:TPR repeat protein
MYEKGLGGMPKDENKAADLYEQAAVHGVRDAVGRLESIAAHGGNPKARYVLGKMYEQGLGGVPKDENKAADLYEQAASAGVREVVPRLQSLAAPGGNPKAQYVLGRIYEGGWVGVGKDGEMARRMYEQAANAGVGEAAEPLGCLLSVLAMNERDRRRQDELNVQAIKWLTFASEQGRPRAQWFLALMYQDGLGGLDVDLDRAVHLLRSAAAQGFALAGCTLGDIYLHELSDFVEAERCYRKAAEHGDEAVSSQTLAGR